jgi:MFS family permease
MRSGGAVFGSLLGGWIASLLGRRFTYFLISLASFATSSFIYSFLTPADPWFSTFAFLLGFVGVTYFGWLPLYLPELFPTRVRATGTGVTFNSGRILAAVSVLGAGVLAGWFHGDYARVGTFTGFVYVAGMVAICFAPDTSKHRLED